MLLLVCLPQGLDGSLMYHLYLFGVHPVKLSQLCFFELDGAGSLLHQLSFVRLDLRDLCLQIGLQLIQPFLMLGATSLELSSVCIFALANFNLFLLNLKLQNLVLV